MALASSAGCALSPDGPTLASLHAREPDLAEAEIDDGLHQAMQGYRAFLEEAPASTLTPEAMRRLADLKLEKEFGLRDDAGPEAMPRPESATSSPESAALGPSAPATSAPSAESDQAFEARTTSGIASEGLGAPAPDLALPGLAQGQVDPSAGPLEAIALYDRILETYPNYAYTDQVLYQKARAYDELGRVDEAIAVATRLATRFPNSRHVDEVQFRRGEYFFTRKKFMDAERAYLAIADRGPASHYFELALYKLGWALYKQMLLEEAIESYVRLLDHKVDSGYDFDQTTDEADSERIADTYRVLSLCFSDLGGAESIAAFFEEHGARDYEDRLYRRLGEFYLEKLRYADAAGAYRKFIDLYPYHESAPRFGMRVIEIYEAGGFPQLVLESKKDFAARYGLRSEYWSHFELEARPEVVAHLKQNLDDLANHYHALYQETEAVEDKPRHFAESVRWYREVLTAFPNDADTPATHYRLADLHLENEGFAQAAIEYEFIAYDYAEHERAAAAGYAAIFAHREHEKRAGPDAKEAVVRAAVASTLRFVERFPGHEHASAVLRAAVDDLYQLREYAVAIEQARRLLDAYPDAREETKRAAWLVIAHASFDTDAFDTAEEAYARVLDLIPAEDEARADIENNLAASIYKRGELARDEGDHRAAANHFLRLAIAAPGSEIRPMAQYDAGTALIALEDWAAAASVFEAFREAFPTNELAGEATRQIALVYHRQDEPGRAAREYQRVAAEAEDEELRRESTQVAGELFEEAGEIERAIEVLADYAAQYPEPVETAVLTRFKLADLHARIGNAPARERELREIIAIDRRAGADRTDLVRLHAARSALLLAEGHFTSFAALRLQLPFEQSLERKQAAMQDALDVFGALLEYEVGEVTAAATYYMGEVYRDFSQSLLASERPAELTASERVEYEMVLEEEAYPFEELAIEVHEKNLELMSQDVFNRWIEKSIESLAIAMPGRYAKFESSTGLLRSSRSYSYRASSDPTPPSDPSAPNESETPVAATSPGTLDGAAAPAPAPAPAAPAPPPEPQEASEDAKP